MRAGAFLMALLFLAVLFFCWHLGRHYEHDKLVSDIRASIKDGQQRPGRFYEIPAIGARVYPANFGFIRLSEEK